MLLLARHLSQDLLQHLHVIVSRVFGLNTLLPERLKNLLAGSVDSEIHAEIVMLYFSSKFFLLDLDLILLILFTTFLFLLVGLLLFLSCKLLHKLLKVLWQAVLLHPLPTTFSRSHLLTTLPDESILLSHLRVDLCTIKIDFGVFLIIVVILLVVLLVVVVVVFVVITATFLLFGLFSCAFFLGNELSGIIRVFFLLIFFILFLILFLLLLLLIIAILLLRLLGILLVFGELTLI